MSVPKFLPGTYITKRYKVIKLLGCGAMGTVYLAKDKKIGANVAVKLLDSSVRSRKTSAARVHQEIRFAYSLDAEYVTGLYNVLIEPDFVGLVLEYVEGESLYDVLESKKQFSIHGVTSLGRNISLGLQAIHKAGIIHRDIKLENIILSTGGVAKITDFGVSLLSSSLEPNKSADQRDIQIDNARLTEDGLVVGTLAYIPPEYLENHQIDTRTDIYALGVLLYEMTTSRYPYEYTSAKDLKEQKIQSDPPHPSSFRSDCPEWLNDLIMKAMHRDPNERFQNIDEIVGLFSGRSLSSVGLFTNNSSVEVKLKRLITNMSPDSFYGSLSLQQKVWSYINAHELMPAISIASLMACTFMAYYISQSEVTAADLENIDYSASGAHQLGYEH